MSTVTFKKMCSDGNYGHEIAEVMLEVDGTDSEQIAASLAQARRLVFDELRASPSRSVRRALEYPRQPVVGTDDPDPDDLPY